MKTNELISSGILEAYVMRVATPDEIRLVEESLHDPLVAQEIREIEESLADLSLKLDKPVPAKVKADLDKLLFGAEVNEVEPVVSEPKVIQLESRNSGFKWLGAAASVALVVSLGLNGYQYMSNQEMKNKMAEMESANTVLAGEVKVVKQDLTFYGAVADFFQKGDIKTINLAAVPNREGSAIVYCDMQSGKVAIKSKSLPALSNEYQYQLWALVDGKPVDLGMIPNDSVGKDQLAMLKSIKGMQAFAITKEVYGGKPQPTMEELVVMGAV